MNFFSLVSTVDCAGAKWIPLDTQKGKSESIGSINEHSHCTKQPQSATHARARKRIPNEENSKEEDQTTWILHISFSQHGAGRIRFCRSHHSNRFSASRNVLRAYAACPLSHACSSRVLSKRKRQAKKHLKARLSRGRGRGRGFRKLHMWWQTRNSKAFTCSSGDGSATHSCMHRVIGRCSTKEW